MSLLEYMQGFIDTANAKINEKREAAAMADKLQKAANELPKNDFDSCKAVLLSMKNNGVITGDKAQNVLNFYIQAVDSGATSVNYRSYLAEALADVKDLHICQFQNSERMIASCFKEAVKVHTHDGDLTYIPDVAKNLPTALKVAEKRYADKKQQREDFEKENAANYELYKQLKEKYAFYDEQLRRYVDWEKNAKTELRYITEFAQSK